MRSDFGYLQGERFLACHIELIDIYRSNLDARGQRATWHGVPIRSIGTPASRATLAYSARKPLRPRLAHRHVGTNSHTGHTGTNGTMAIVPRRHRGASVLICRLCFSGFRSSFLVNPVLRRLEKNTTVDKHWLIKPMRRLRNT